MTDVARLARDLERRIETEYRQGGYDRLDLGWRLLASPVEVLGGSRVAFVGLNPGGRANDPFHAVFAPQLGSAYLLESWGGHAAGQSPLQKQILGLFSRLGVPPEQVLAGNLVPFRSPNWNALQNKRRALAFGKSIWSLIIAQTQPQVVISMGREVFIALSDAFQVTPQTPILAGWGEIRILRGRNEQVELIGLPHLSRFALMNRPASETALAEAFGRRWQKP